MINKINTINVKLFVILYLLTMQSQAMVHQIDNALLGLLDTEGILFLSEIPIDQRPDAFYKIIQPVQNTQNIQDASQTVAPSDILRQHNQDQENKMSDDTSDGSEEVRFQGNKGKSKKNKRMTEKRAAFISRVQLQCNICQEIMAGNYSVLTHVAKHLEAYEAKECSEDPEKFIKKIGANQFKCAICIRFFGSMIKAFSNEHKCKNHIRNHCRTKRFECNQCEKKYVNRDSLRKHIKSHKK